VAKLALFLSAGMYVMVVGGYVARAAGEPSIIKVSFHLFVIYLGLNQSQNELITKLVLFIAFVYVIDFSH
jgi:hypothetical protein